MIKTIIIGICVVVFIIIWRIYKKDKGVPLLKVIISFNEDNNTSVEFKLLHTDCKNIEYVRLILHYYAKVLFIFDPNQAESTESYNFLLNAVDSITKSKLTPTTDILRISDIDDVVKISNKVDRKYKFEAILYCISAVRRHIITRIPIRYYLQQLSFSVPVLIQSSISKLNNDELNILCKSLNTMNKQYRNGVDFKNINNLASVPINAYVTAIE